MPDSHLRIQTAEKRLVLVVDDEQINREILGMTLADEYDVIFAENGQEALEKIAGSERQISLVLLDLLMPVMTGITVLEQLKQSPQWSKLPVIVMTSDQKSEVECLELGAMDFISKPYPAKGVILARIRRIIELSEDREIIHSTERDTLTGLYNREYFYNYASSYDQYHKEDPMDALIVDINRFHLIVDRYGRIRANQILKHVGRNLRDTVQQTGGIVGRREEDIFMIYCPHRDDYSDMLAFAVKGIEDENGNAGKIRLRMGVYRNVDKSVGVEQRFDRAKAAADQLRGNYSKSIAAYDTKMYEEELFAEKLTEDFEQAIREKQFKVYYQPKYDVRGERPVLYSAEALVRWEHPVLGMLSPGVFIPLFEENGMIRRLDTYIWEEAVRQINRWREKYGRMLRVSVNVSRVSISDPDIVPYFRQLLAEGLLDPEDMCLEVTESAYMDDEDYIIATVRELRELGFKVEMDDFGSGYSSLGMISRLPIDALKLDMAFVRNAFSGNGDVRMIELVLDIANYLNVPVIAEGVETKEQVEVLKELGCHIIQGHYFSKPVPAEDFALFIEEKTQMLAAGLSDTLPREIKTHMAFQRNDSLTFARIAQALAADYFSIYYVDIQTDTFFEFTAHAAYENLGIEKGGDDFFNLSRRNIARVMYPDDQKKFLQAFTKENILKKIRENGTFTITYRLQFDGEPNYVSLKATSMGGGDASHIVIGVNNIQAEMQREMEFEQNLESARRAARKDALTGVKSKFAFTEKEQEINNAIRSGDQKPFAVVVCDLNGLKEINDTKGHKAGDQYIKDACAQICEQFKHSPVFRIGGDEFVVILQGTDYWERDMLLSRFRVRNEKNVLNGDVVIACGVSEWSGDQSETIEQVFECADEAMYINKKDLKA